MISGARYFIRTVIPSDVWENIKVYEFKIVLRNTRPAVERHILVTGDHTLQLLGKAAICAVGMAYEKFNLWGPDDEYITGYDPFNSNYDSDTDSEETRNRKSENLIISEFFNLNKRNQIVLDYGHEGWRYVITLIKIREKDLIFYPHCISGKNACPPEDVGGPEGYKHLLKTIKNPNHKEHNESKDWLTSRGYKDFDPNKFTVTSVVFGL